ncbi:hypothetical protein AGMMS49938_15800 [Fibrobacterales bacterium]|nr:hypothetical protein AGMMS49938_15800 [Fibrobacterales bacterium]
MSQISQKKLELLYTGVLGKAQNSNIIFLFATLFLLSNLTFAQGTTGSTIWALADGVESVSTGGGWFSTTDITVNNSDGIGGCTTTGFSGDEGYAIGQDLLDENGVVNFTYTPGCSYPYPYAIIGFTWLNPTTPAPEVWAGHSGFVVEYEFSGDGNLTMNIATDGDMTGYDDYSFALSKQTMGKKTIQLSQFSQAGWGNNVSLATALALSNAIQFKWEPGSASAERNAQFIIKSITWIDGELPNSSSSSSTIWALADGVESVSTGGGWFSTTDITVNNSDGIGGCTTTGFSGDEGYAIGQDLLDENGVVNFTYTPGCSYPYPYAIIGFTWLNPTTPAPEVWAGHSGFVVEYEFSGEGNLTMNIITEGEVAGYDDYSFALSKQTMGKKTIQLSQFSQAGWGNNVSLATALALSNAIQFKWEPGSASAERNAQFIIKSITWIDGELPHTHEVNRVLIAVVVSSCVSVSADSVLFRRTVP